MAKREDEFDLDFGGMDDFDLGDPFGDGLSPKDDRSPTTKFVGGFLSGVKDTAKKPSTYIDVMRKALPEGYSAAYEVAEDVTGKGLGLYNEVVTDLRPAMRDLKRLMYRAKTAVDSVLPDSLSKKLDGWLKEKEREARGDSNYDPTELKIASDLAEIFKVQAEAKAEDDKKGLLEQAVESKRHRTQTEQLDEVRISLKKLASYQDTITYAYQKKSLELQYRQFYAQRDLLEITKASTQESVTLLRGIQKNTGLPDIQKTFDTELATRLTKERLYGAVQERIAPYAREFLNPFFKNIGRRVKEKTSEFTDMVGMIAMGAESADEAAQMMEEFGISKEEMAGKEIGGGISGWLARVLGKRLRPFVEKNQKVVAGGYRAGYLAENYDVILKELLEDATPNNPLLQMLQESALEALRVRAGTKVGYDDISRSTERVPWDNLSRKSLVEVIPGFLARILQSSEGIRTGGNADLMTYDHKTNKFMTTKALASNIRTQAVDNYNLERIANRTNEVIDKMDPTKSIAPEVRRKLQMHLVKSAQQNKGFSVKKFTDEYELIQAGFSPAEAEQIADVLRMTLDADYDGNVAFTPEAEKSRRDIARDIRSLREMIPSVYEFANINANTGNREAMRMSGITSDLRGEDHVNQKFLLERMSSFLRGDLDANAASEIFTDSSSIPTVNGRGRRTSYVRDNSRAIMEALKTSVLASQSMQQEIKNAAEKSPAGFDARSEFDRLIEVLREESTKTQATEASTVLREILEIVDSIQQNGINTHVAEMVDSPEARNWKRLRGVGRTAKGFGKTLFKPVKGLWGLGKGYARGVTGALGSSWTAAKTLGSAMFEPIRDRMQDIYVPGEAEPRIKAALLQAGEYLDEKTGKAIKSIKDIKGRVVDKAGNVILDAKEIKKGLLTRDGKPIGTRLLGGMVDMGLNALGWAKDQLGKGFMLPFSATKAAFESLKKTMRRTPDVYVLGEMVPRLKGSLLRAGHYVSAKTGKPIFTVDDIDGDVLDSTTGEVILEASDAAKGLVDRWGKPIRTVLGRITDIAKKGFDVSMGALKWGGGQLLKGFGLVKDLAKGGYNALKGMASGVSIGGPSMDPVVSSVDRIYDLLVKYFISKGMSEEDIEREGIFDPQSGDVKVPGSFKNKVRSISDMVRDKADSLKNRAGSWWNRKQGWGKNDGTPKERKEKAQKESSGSSWLTTLVMALGSVGGGIVSAIKWLGGIMMGKAAVGALGDLADIGGDGPDRKGKKGRGGRTPRGKGGLLRGLARGAGSLAWGTLKFAGRAALFAGLGALKLGAAAASVLTAPVVLGAAAVAVAGYGAYKAYRYFKDRLKPLQRLRFSQYGLPLEELNKCAIVGQLEMDAEKHVVWSDGKAINIDSRFDVVGQFERFGVDGENKRQVADFANWFQYRFKPVYLTHITVLSKLSPGKSLQEADDIYDYLKVTYAKATRYSPEATQQPYQITTSPFPDLALVRGREIIDQEVMNVIEENKRAIKPEAKAAQNVKSKNPDVKREMPTTANPSGVVDTKRTEFVTQASAPTSPLGSLINPNKGSPSTFVDPSRTNFVSSITAAETAADLANRTDSGKKGDGAVNGLYDSIPSPSGNGSWDAVKGTLMAVAGAMGIDVRKLAVLAKLESSFNINAKAKTSSAKGLFQFIASTWRGLMDKYAGKFGIPRNAQPTDPKAAAILAGQFLKLNEDSLSGTLGRTPDLTESYLAHFLGAGGSRTFLKADRSALAADVLPEAARTNRSIFYRPDGSARTVAEVIEVMRNKVEGASNLTASVPTQVSDYSGNVVSLTGATAVPPESTEPKGFDDGRANRSSLLMKAPSRSVLAPALPTQTNVATTATTAYSTYTPTRSANEPSVVDMERKEVAMREARKRQVEQQQISNAQLQREDLNVAVELAREALKVQYSMDESLKVAVMHLRNLETLAKAEKAEAKVEKVPELGGGGLRSSAPPTARLAMTRKSF